MIVKNPTNQDISVVIEGVPYEIKAEDSIENVPEAHARYWQESLHKFLILKKDTPKAAKAEEVAPEVKEEIEEAPVEEAEEEVAPEEEAAPEIEEEINEEVEEEQLG